MANKNVKKMTAVIATTMLMNPMTTFAEEIRAENAPETVNNTMVKSAEMEYVEKVETITQEINSIQNELNTLETEFNATQTDVVNTSTALETATANQEGMQAEVEEEALNRVEESKKAVEDAGENLSTLEAEKDTLGELTEPDDTEVNELEKIEEDTKEKVTEYEGIVQEIENDLTEIDSSIKDKEVIENNIADIIDKADLTAVENTYEDSKKYSQELAMAITKTDLNGDTDKQGPMFDEWYVSAKSKEDLNNYIIAISDSLEAENTYNNSYTTMLTSQAKLDAINNLLEAESKGEIELEDKDKLLAEKAELEGAIPALTEKAAQDKAEYEEYKSKLAETFPDVKEGIEAGNTLLNFVYETNDKDLQKALDDYLTAYNELVQFTEDNKNFEEELNKYATSRAEAAQASADIIRLNAEKQIAEAKKAKAEELYNEAVAELGKAQEELTKAIDKYNADTEAYKEYVKELERLNTEIEKAKAELEKAEGDLSKAEGILANVKDGIFETVDGDPAYTKYNELVNKYLEKTLEVKELEKNLANLKSEQESNTQKRAELEAKLTEAKAELEQAHRDLAEYLASKEEAKPTQTAQTTKKPSVSGNINTAVSSGFAASSTMFAASSAGLIALLKRRRDLNKTK